MRTPGITCLLLTLLTGCGADQAGEAPPASQPAEAAPSAPPATPVGDLELPEGLTGAMVEQGRTVFESAGFCYTCHGQNGEGTQLGPDLTDDAWLHVDGSYEQIVDLIDAGVPEAKEFPGVMVPRGGSGISDDDLRAVAAYVWSLSQSGS